jgi:hypothetical protein
MSAIPEMKEARMERNFCVLAEKQIREMTTV